MFVGREDELSALEMLYQKTGFQMVVVYGRRRVGKTTLLDEFAGNKHTLYFTAQEQSALLNLRVFSQTVYRFFGLPAQTGAFDSWSSAFSFIAEKAKTSSQRLVLMFDEFPYAAASEPSLPSALQIAIDHEFKGTNLYLVLCGSNEGFMESDVLGRKSPLYGRRTAQMRVRAFDYLDAARMLPKSTVEDRIKYYATFGGTPYYLSQIDSDISYEENVSQLFFNKSGLLYEEPLMLLRQELREPALYNSVLDAIGEGATKPKVIAERAGIGQNSIGKYLKTLESLGLVLRKTPFGENALRSRKSIYTLGDPFFSYWYRFVGRNVGAIENGAGEAVARQTAFGDTLSTYIGSQFESVCLQWVIRQNRAQKLPFIASAFGNWWGTDPVEHEEVDVDVVAGDKVSNNILLGECKWRTSFNETEEIGKLKARASLIKGYNNHSYILFTKNRTSEATARKAASIDELKIVTAENLFEDQ